jgi:hypothetical protein
MNTLQIALESIILIFVIATFGIVLAYYTKNNSATDCFEIDTRAKRENFDINSLQISASITPSMLINLCYNLWSTLLQAGSYGSQVFLDMDDTKYLPYNYKQTVTGTAQDYLAKKNLIETPNVDVIYNSIVVDFRAMANEKTDKIYISLDMPNIDERYYIIQFCDIMGYDIIPLTPASDGVIRDSTAISSKSNTGKFKTWSIVSPLYEGALDPYTCKMNSRQAYIMMRVHVTWDLETGCTSTIQPNLDYQNAMTFLNQINYTFPEGMKNSDPQQNTPTERENNLKAFNCYYPNIATNGSSAAKSFEKYNAQNLSGPLDPRSLDQNFEDSFTAFVWYAANQILNVPLYWDQNLTNFGFYLSNWRIRNQVDDSVTISSNNCPKLMVSSNPCTDISSINFRSFVMATKLNINLQTITTERTTNLNDSQWSLSAAFTEWMDKTPESDPYYYTEKAYLMFDRTWIYIFANIPYDALYFSAAQLENGDAMNSANEYSLVLKSNNWPTTAVEEGWWSIVSYDSADFYNNVDCRFTVGSPQMPDGFNTTVPYTKDVTILMTPTPEKYENTPTQLIMGTPPTPTDFYVCFRLYAPSADVIQNKWQPGPIIIV